MPTTDRQVFHLALAELIRRQSEPLIARPEDLTAFELGVYSQNGEDGVLAEIFRRLGPGRREFVEFGVGRGVEGNCVALAGVNAFFVRDDCADSFEDLRCVPRRSQNYDGHGYGNPEHPGGGRYVELDG